MSRTLHTFEVDARTRVAAVLEEACRVMAEALEAASHFEFHMRGGPKGKITMSETIGAKSLTRVAAMLPEEGT